MALVERDARPGGVSVHTGTLPSKTLRETALYLTGFQRGALYGISVKLDRRRSLRSMAGRLRDVVERQEKQIIRNLDRHRIEVVRGRARFVAPRVVGVFDASGREARRLGSGRLSVGRRFGRGLWGAPRRTGRFERSSRRPDRQRSTRRKRVKN